MRTKTVLSLALAAALVACGERAPAEDVATAEGRGVGLLERFDEKDLHDAVETLGDVVRRAPEWREARINHAIALAAIKKPEASAEALAELDRVLAEDPREPHALFVGALVRRFMGNGDAGLPLLERLLEVDPDEPSVWYWIGTIQMESPKGDLARAEQAFRRALALAPNDASTEYSLFQVLARTGKGSTPEAEALKAAFQGAEDAKEFGSPALAKHAKRGDQEYGEAGPYARAIKDFAAPTGALFADGSKSAGLDLPGGAVAIAVGDLDGDGDDDLVLVLPDGAIAVRRNDGGRFADATAASGLPRVAGAKAALLVDLDEDGRPDLVVAGEGVTAFRNAGGLRFEAIPAEKLGAPAGGYAALAAADLDHDGDIDLLVAGAKTRWLRNRRDGTFPDVSDDKKIVADGATGLSLFDADGDAVTDLVAFGPDGPPRLLRNGRLGPWIADDRLAALGPAVSGTAGDVDGDGRMDLVLVRPDGSLALARGDDRGNYALDPTFPTLRLGARFAVVEDLDLDGRPDVLAVGKHVSVVRGLGDGRYRVEGTNLPEQDRSAVGLLDVDGDGDLDVVLVAPGRPPEVLRNEAPPSRHALRLRLRGIADRKDGRTWSNSEGIGAVVDAKARDLVARRVVTCGNGFPGQRTTRVVVGLGDRPRAEFVLVHWTDGVLQSEVDVAPDHEREIEEVNRKVASCPVVFAWDGTTFRYVTDCLGVGGLGFYSGPSVGYPPPDPTETLLLPTLRPKDGAYQVSLLENLEEVSYLDEARLLVVDHPRGIEIHPDERFAVEEPMPEDRLYGVEEPIAPVAATDDAGRDVLPLLLEEDRKTVEGFEKDSRWLGFAKPHALTLDFGDRLPALAPGERLVLFLAGWIEYGYSKTYFGAGQAGVEAEPPTLEVPDGAGGWKKAAAIGYPAGNTRTMTYDVTAILGPKTPRCRIHTNLEVYWDRIYVARDRAPGRIRVTTLTPASAALAERGYPREFTPDGLAPTLYDYASLEAWVPFRPITGDYTRFGDVSPLVLAADDRFVVFGKGEEVSLRFDASALPPPKEGEARTFLLRLDGYCKDRDPYTALGDTVEPLPFHAMSGYPYPAAEHYPDDPAHLDYRARWNTRRVDR